MATELLPRRDGERKTALVTIDADNRDHGKKFFLKELPANQAERWALKVVALLARRGVQVPVGSEMAGMAALPSFSPLAMMSWIDDEALVGEIMSCVQAWPEGSPIARALVPSDVEEVLTRVYLKMEVIALQRGFLDGRRRLDAKSIPGGGLESAAASRAARGLIDYPNVPHTIALVIGGTPQLAGLHELGTVYGLEDLHDFLEILSVDSLNQAKMAKIAELEARRNRENQ